MLMLVNVAGAPAAEAGPAVADPPEAPPSPPRLGARAPASAPLNVTTPNNPTISIARHFRTRPALFTHSPSVRLPDVEPGMILIPPQAERSLTATGGTG